MNKATADVQNMNKLHVCNIGKHAEHCALLRATYIIWKSVKKHIAMIDTKFRIVVTFGECKQKGICGKIQLHYVFLGWEVDT